MSRKKQMKKSLIVLIAILTMIMLVFCGCGDKSKEGNDKKAGTETEQTVKEKNTEDDSEKKETDNEEAAENKSSSSGSSSSNKTSKSSSSNSSSSSSSSSTKHTHKWQPVYEEKIIYVEQDIIGNVCNDCSYTSGDIGAIEDHISSAGHSGYYSDVIGTEKVHAGSEDVLVGHKCSCGATK